jgi:hypothetical protein
MAIALRDIVLTYIDEALDIDDLETMEDFINSTIMVENLQDWQLADVFKQLYADLSEAFETEKNRARRLRLKSALEHFEADFADFLINKETGSLSSHA